MYLHYLLKFKKLFFAPSILEKKIGFNIEVTIDEDIHSL